MNYLSDIPQTDFYNQVKYHLPISKRIDETAIQNWIKNAMSRYSKIYIDNSKGAYDVIEEYDFYNTESIAINIRELGGEVETRWCLLQPSGLYLNKLKSCMLKTIVPDDLILPVGVAYVQDVPIAIFDSRDVNTTVPDANTGGVALVSGRQIMSVLSIDDTGTPFSNIIQITALYAGYRNIVYPNWSSIIEGYTMDILKKDVELVCNYVVQEAYLPNKAPLGVETQIRDSEYQIIYGS